uniref:Cytochrome P450, family 2, subfamily R, polypeptide 1 n=1 Tax=Myripristis murdjan TaxID=586833 RepID=A0A667XZ02_9TELE
MWCWLDVQSLLLFSVVFLVIADYVKNRRPNSFPPGPWALPFVGNIFSVDFSKTHESLTKVGLRPPHINNHKLHTVEKTGHFASWLKKQTVILLFSLFSFRYKSCPFVSDVFLSSQFAETYGDVYSLRMGQTWMVVLNGFNTLKEALLTQGHCFSNDVFFLSGIITTNGHMWKHQRRFALFTLKYFGVGKKSLESAIVDESMHFCKEIADLKGEPFNPHIITNNAVANIICTLVFGHRFEYGDEKFMKLMGLTCSCSVLLTVFLTAQLYNSFPVLMRRVPGPHHTIRKIYSDFMDLIKVDISKHKEDWDPSEPRDYIDCYLSEIQKSNGDAFAEATFYEDNLIICALELFVAGSETTSTTLRWAFLYMAKYPEIQEKVQAEIDRVIGQSRQPSMMDRANLPYTDAVIHEILRMGNIVPLSLPHSTNNEMQLGNYTIPKGVVIIPNLTSVLFDKKEWETPYTFNPGHFLNEEGKFVKRAAFIPFSAGKRVCLGENLARMELFLFFTSFMQRFTFSMPSGVKPVLDYRFGVTLAPIQYKICAKLRQVSSSQ